MGWIICNPPHVFVFLFLQSPMQDRSDKRSLTKVGQRAYAFLSTSKQSQTFRPFGF